MAIAQQVVPAELGRPLLSREQLREAARVWIKEALKLGQEIRPPLRTSEYD